MLNMVWYLILLPLLYFVHKCLIIPYFYWKKLGIPHNSPLPYFGNFFSVMTHRKNIVNFHIDEYKQFSDQRYFGNFHSTTATLVIRDLELIKQIGITHFDHFMDHRSMGSTDEALFYKNLIALKGNEWRQMRAFLSPAFSSSKVANTWSLIESCVDNVIYHYLEIKEEYVDVELKDLFMRYANDVISSCAFGVECDSLKDPTNELFEAGRNMTNFPKFRGLKILVRNFFPVIAKFLKFRMFSKKKVSFFSDLIKRIITQRKANKVMRPDVINLLLKARDKNFKNSYNTETTKSELKENRLENISDVDIAAQCFIFYMTGFDTISTVLSFAFTELAINPDIQQKLYQEINHSLSTTNGKMTYEMLMDMKYLDMIISETLRKWPPAPSIDRTCTEDFTIEPKRPGETTVHVNFGDIVTIPIIGLHRDPQYFRDPDRFDPERFSEKNRIIPYSYIPFGIGPRACIASRFALVEIKLLMAQFLHTFEVYVINKTTVPIELAKRSFKLGQAPEDGFWVGLKRRNVNN